MNAILIGGGADGRRMMIPVGTTRVKIAIISTSMDPSSYEEQTYNLFRLHPVTRAVVFAYERLTPTEIMEHLLDGYRAEKESQ